METATQAAERAAQNAASGAAAKQGAAMAEQLQRQMGFDPGMGMFAGVPGQPSDMRLSVFEAQNAADVSLGFEATADLARDVPGVVKIVEWEFGDTIAKNVPAKLLGRILTRLLSEGEL